MEDSGLQLQPESSSAPCFSAENWLAELYTAIPKDRVLTRYLERVAYASDASLYRLIPRAVVQPDSIEEIQALCRFSARTKIPVTFRAAGTSLSGQAVTDGVLVDISKFWGKISVEAEGKLVRLQPGVIGQKANAVLARYHAKIGPDPASINACMIGGILANNASGMCCGVAQNAYHTLHCMKFVLPDGTMISSEASDAEDEFQRRAPRLAQGLLELRKEVLASPGLTEKIRRKYLQKNTTGYSLNALLDFERSIDIMQHVLIGSEGTLAFIAEAVLKTVPSLPCKYTGLLMFETIAAAAEAIIPLRDSGAVALELMDRASLRSVEGLPGIPPYFADLPETAAGLLVEYQAESPEALQVFVKLSGETNARLKLEVPADFTLDGARQAAFWHVRKGLFPSVGSVRAKGSTVIIEDIVFPVEKLAAGISGLQDLFRKHRYHNAIIFGHAKDGNLHFVITPTFDGAEAVESYSAFMKDMVELVVRRFDGALKAEHGTGRNIAPFVEAEWGAEAYGIMCRLKQLVDPDELFNPGVIINRDPQCFVKDIKSLPEVEEEVDKCIECGFCEPKCPSRTLSLSPRQRIVVRREMARLRNGGGNAVLARSLDADFVYDGIETCAADGLCASACPVSIDTGALVKRLRKTRISSRGARVARSVAVNFLLVERAARWGLNLGHAANTVFGQRMMQAVSGAAQNLFGIRIPRWMNPMPKAAPAKLPPTSREGAAAVYFTSCVSRTMGLLPGERKTTPQGLVELAARAGCPLWIPEGVAGKCCGTAFSSKGYETAAKIVFNRLVQDLWDWTGGGKLPVVIDTSPCTFTLRTARELLDPELKEKYSALRILDSVEFLREYVLPGLKIKRKKTSVVLHPVCSLQKLGLTGALDALAKACAERAETPISAGCCGFAGDRGLLYPELPGAALRDEAQEVLSGNYDGFYSTSRTCELGLAQQTGRPYQSIVHLLDEASEE